jgi:hypothetical protein
MYTEIKQGFQEGQKKMKNNYDFYNLVEKKLIDVELSEEEKNQMVGDLLHKLKTLAMELSRNKPTDWNKFMDVIVS